MPSRGVAGRGAAVAALAAGALAGCGSEPRREAVRQLEIRAAPVIVKDGPVTRPVSTRRRPPAAGRRAPAPPQPAEVPRVGSVAVGKPNKGRLVNGVQLAETGPGWVTWDPILHRTPNRPERRWSTDATLAFVAGVLRAYRRAHPAAPPVLVGDLSRPRGGVFDKRYGGLGHASHQNGLDADVYYPRRDGTLRAATRVSQIDRRLAQDLVDGFVAAGAQFVFVGLHTKLEGPKAVVQAIPAHDDHVHVRIFKPRRPGGR